MRQLCTAIPSVDIPQTTCQFYILVIINKFCTFCGNPYYKNIIFTALHLVLSFVEMA